MSDSIFLEGIALANYRGIGDDIVRLGPFQRFNFFIGQNNSGKSTFLYFIAKHLTSDVMPKDMDWKGSKIVDLDRNRISNKPPTMAFGVDFQRSLAIIKSAYPRLFLYGDVPTSNIISLIFGEVLNQDMLWLKQSVEGDFKFNPLPDIDPESHARSLLKHQQVVRDIWQELTGRSGGTIANWARGSLTHLINSVAPVLPPIQFIPAIRQISERGQDFSDWSGRGLIDELGRHQNPGYDERIKRNKFVAINAFVKAVTENSTAEIEIPHDRQHILVHMDGKILPLSALGTGVQEVIMLAAACTLHDDQIICIEEPEIHLHPLLQRRLIQYLKIRTTNQYFIATHSASIIDATEAAVFHVSMQEARQRQFQH
jgi:predicted ATPase